MFLITELKLCPVPVTLEQVRHALKIGLILHFFNLILGILALVGLIFGELFVENRRLFQHVLKTDSPDNFILILVTLSACIMLMCGVVGIISQFLCYPKMTALLLPVFTALAWCIAILALIKAFSMDTRSDVEFLSRSLVREAYSAQYSEQIDAVFKRPDAWEANVQSELECCGIFDKSDWMLSKCNCTPPSCCKTTEQSSCKSQFVESTDPFMYQKLELDNGRPDENLWEETCGVKVESMIESFRKFWTTSLTIFVCLYFWPLVILAYLCFIIQELNETDRGQSQLSEYRCALPVRKRLTHLQTYKTFKALQRIRSEELLLEVGRKVLQIQSNRTVYKEVITL